MIDAWSDLQGRGESYEEALARSVVLRPSQALTEAEIAAKIVESRERMKMHDSRFRNEYISGPEQVMISRKLARILGAPEQYEGE